jgi:adenylate cyclase
MENVIRRLRLGSGLVMFAYVTTHFLNHSLGLLSVDVMDRVLEHVYRYWSSALGGVILYGAFATHYSLAVGAVAAPIPQDAGRRGNPARARILDSVFPR